MFLAAVRKWEILAATKVKMSEWKKVNNNRYDISFIKGATIGSFWKFHVVVVQNNGEEVYKKSVLYVQSCFFAHLLLSFHRSRCLRRFYNMILYFVWANYKYYRELRF